MNTITFDNGSSMKILMDNVKWNKFLHKYFNSSLNTTIITLLCIQKYYYKNIDKNIFLKIIEEIADISYLLDASIFADFIITNQKRMLLNTYDYFKVTKSVFTGKSAKKVNPKYLKDGNSFIITRGRNDIQTVLEEIKDEKILGFVMLIDDTLEIIYLDLSKYICVIDLVLNFSFLQDLKKKEEFYNILRNSSINHSSLSLPFKNISIKNYLILCFFILSSYLTYFFIIPYFSYLF